MMISFGNFGWLVGWVKFSSYALGVDSWPLRHVDKSGNFGLFREDRGMPRFFLISYPRVVDNKLK